MFASEAKQPRNDNRQSRFIKDCPRNESRHKTHNIQKGGARNVLNGMCKSFEGMWPKSGLRNVGGHPPGYRRGY